MILSQHVDNSEWRKSLLAAAELGDPRALDIYNRCLEREGRHAEKIGYTSKPILPVSARGLVAGLTLCGLALRWNRGVEVSKADGPWMPCAGIARYELLEAMAEAADALQGSRLAMWRMPARLEDQLLTIAARECIVDDGADSPVQAAVDDWLAAQRGKPLALTLHDIAARAKVLNSYEGRGRLPRHVYADIVTALHAAGWERRAYRVNGNSLKRWRSPAHLQGERLNAVKLSVVANTA